MSSSSSTSPAGRSRAALRSRSVAAITRNSLASSRAQSSPSFCRFRMYLMNSSVTVAMATSVMSSWCLAISPRRRSNGPVKLASRTSKPGLVSATAWLGCAAARNQFLGEPAVSVGPHMVGGIARDGFGGHGGVGELDGALDDGFEDLVPEGLHQAGDHFAAVQRAG